MVSNFVPSRPIDCRTVISRSRSSEPVRSQSEHASQGKLQEKLTESANGDIKIIQFTLGSQLLATNHSKRPVEQLSEQPTLKAQHHNPIAIQLSRDKEFRAISLDCNQNHQCNYKSNHWDFEVGGRHNELRQAKDKSLTIASRSKSGRISGAHDNGNSFGNYNNNKDKGEDAASADSDDCGPPFKFAGIIACASSTIFFSLSLLCVKLLPDSESIQEKTKAIWFRGLCLMALCAGSMIYDKVSFKINCNEIPINIVRAIVGFFGSYGTYIALHYITVGESTAIIYSSPVWTSLLSYFLLGEPIPLTLVLALPLGALGIVMIAHPDLIIGLILVEDEVLAEVERLQHPIVINDSIAILPHHINSTSYMFLTNGSFEESVPTTQSISGRMIQELIRVRTDINISEFDELLPQVDRELATELYLDHRLPGIIISLATSLFVSLVFISLKYRRESNVQRATFYLGFGIVIIATLIHCFVGFGRWPSTYIEWALLIGVGLNSWIAQTLFQWSLSHDTASVLSVVRTVDVVMAFLWSALFLEEDILWTSLVGAAIIVGIVVILMLNNTIERLLCFRPRG